MNQNRQWRKPVWRPTAVPPSSPANFTGKHFKKQNSLYQTLFFLYALFKSGTQILKRLTKSVGSEENGDWRTRSFSLVLFRSSSFWVSLCVMVWFFFVLMILMALMIFGL
jgi:hypothetical protein